MLRCIGRGSYGEVWLAQNVLGIYRAVKVVFRNRFADDRPYERELEGIQKFEPISRSHEGFVDILQVGRNDPAGYFYYVMELADDRQNGQQIDPVNYVPKTLGREVRTEPRLPIDECLQLGLSLSNALGCLHDNQLVHRDVKPSNIIFVNGVPKLADIGLVADIDATLSFVGTEGFVPREGPGSPQADLFSLGKVLYEISTGEDRHRFPHLPTECNDLVSNPQFSELNEIILRACKNAVQDRYQTAEEMHADLTFLLNGKSVKRLRLLERRLAQAKRFGLTAAICLAIAAIAWFQVSRERKHRAEIRQREIGSQTAYGIQTLDGGQFVESLSSFVGVLGLDTAQREAMHRVRIGLILDQCPKLLQMWSNSTRIHDSPFSPDGRCALLASFTNRVQVVDVEGGQACGPIFGNTNFITTASFSPDGALVVTADTTQATTIWDCASGQPVLTLLSGRITAANFNHAGNQVVTAGRDGITRVWDFPSGDLVLACGESTNLVAYATFSPNDNLILTSGWDNSARIWDARDGRPLGKFLHKSWVNRAVFSPDGSRVATASQDHTACLWDVATGRQVVPPLRHPDVVGTIEFSPDGRLVVTACWDSTARIWDAATGQPVNPNPILKHSSRVLHASFHPDGHRILTICLDGTSRLWDLAGSMTITPRVNSRFSENGAKFLVASNGGWRVKDTISQKLYPGIDVSASPDEMALSPNGRFLVTRCREPEAGLIVWETGTGKQLYSVPSVRSVTNQVAVSDDGQWLACFWTNSTRLFPFAEGKSPLKPPAHFRSIQHASFSPDGRQLLRTGRGEVSLWDMKTGNLLLHDIQPFDVIVAASFSEDGKLIVTCNSDDRLTEFGAQVWETATGKRVGPPLPHRRGVLAAAFSPHNERIVTASDDYTALIWDRIKGGEPKLLQHEHKVHEACFNPSGSWVLTASHDQTARLWEAETGEPLSPPLPHDFDLVHGIFLDETSFLVSATNGGSWIWKIKPDPRPLEDLVLIAEILNGKRPPANLSAPSPETVYSRWRKMKAKYPEEFATSHEKIVAWHRKQAALSKEDKQWAAALFHYRQLMSLEPDDESIIELQRDALQSQAQGAR